MEKSSPRLAYETPYLAKLVNSLPRFDLSLHRVNATFLPDSHDYKEVHKLYTRLMFLKAVVLKPSVLVVYQFGNSFTAQCSLGQSTYPSCPPPHHVSHL